MGIRIAMTGASGNMGREALSQLFELSKIEKIKILVLSDKKNRAFARRAERKYGKRLEVICGDIADLECCERLVSDVDYVFHLAAVIPPLSDSAPRLSYLCNYIGTKNIVDSVKNQPNQPKLVHISTVALYGHRNHLHPFGRVGDPLIPSAYDSYSSDKLRGERYVLDAELKCFAVLRQTAMLHKNMLMDNIKDGLMFHTYLNVPLEWVSARDSGLLIRRIVERDTELAAECDMECDAEGLKSHQTGENISDFWNKCYNIGSLAENRQTGYEVFGDGFKLIGGSVEKFMQPYWYSIRNFHGLWFYDGDKLNRFFDFQHDSLKMYWKEVLKTHRYYHLARVVPPKLISRIILKPLTRHKNAPHRWVADGERARVKAFFGSSDNVECIGLDWKDYPLLAKGRLPDADIDYLALKQIENAVLLDHGYDESKPDSRLDLLDMQRAAAFRGGKCLSKTMQTGDLYTKLEWECHDGHRFFCSPYTILKCGHWCQDCCKHNEWDFDKLAKFVPFYAQIWYDTHAREENCKYYYDSEYRAKHIYYK